MALAVGVLRDVVLLTDVVESLRKAASSDPIAAEFLGEDRHGDGWGALIIGFRDSKPSAFHYRSVRPIFEEDPVGIIKPYLSSLVGGTVVVMVHARAASTGTPVNVFSTHPVKAVTRGGSELYMMHNGSFNKDDILKLLNLGDLAGRYNDTYIANLALAGRVSNDVNRDDLAWLLNYTRTGANLGVVLVGDGVASVVVGSYFRLMGDGKDELRERYYRLYHCNANDLWVYTSSTLIEHYRPTELRDCRPLINGEYHKYVVSGNGVEAPEAWTKVIG
jgi:glutamine amidotransferase